MATNFKITRNQSNEFYDSLTHFDCKIPKEDYTTIALALHTAIQAEKELVQGLKKSNIDYSDCLDRMGRFQKILDRMTDYKGHEVKVKGKKKGKINQS